MKTDIQSKLRREASKLPDTPGVYFFIGKKGEILYIGKATSLRSRVRSYFAGDILDKRSPLIAKMVEEARSVKVEKTDTVLEALILEANLIKKYQPPYNTDEKDQKSWNYVVITDEEWPRVLLVRERDLKIKNLKFEISEAFGPYPHGGELKEALKVVRKIFPYRDRCVPESGKPCFNYQIGLCPGVCAGAISKTEYKGTIRNIKLFFSGKKKTLIKSLEKEMKSLAKAKKFEEASSVKKQIFALNHIQDVSILKVSDFGFRASDFRIEGYDVAHIAGTSVVGVMTVVEDGEVQKGEYRKFKLSKQVNNDTGALREILERRLAHTEWQYPRLIVVDGGKGQLNTARTVLRSVGVDIPVVSVVKDDKHKPREIMGKHKAELEKSILLANSEAHRFAIKYHRRLRSNM